MRSAKSPGAEPPPPTNGGGGTRNPSPLSPGWCKGKPGPPLGPMTPGGELSGSSAAGGPVEAAGGAEPDCCGENPPL